MKSNRPLIYGAAIVAVAAIVAIVALRGEPAGSSPEATAEAGIPIADVLHIHGIAVDQNDPSRLFLATHHGVYQTSPDGVSAVLISANQNDYMGFSPHPSDPLIIFASGHPTAGGNVGVIVSRDGGRSWEQLAIGAGGPVDFHAMSVSRADPNVIYGLYGGVQVSLDGGRTWTVAGRPPVNVYDLTASAVDPNIVYAATALGVMVSRDAGVTWQPTGEQGQPASMVETGPDGTVYAFIVGHGLVRSPGAVPVWSDVDTNLGQAALVHLAVHPSDPTRLFAVDDAGRILASLDGGSTWGPFEATAVAP